MPGSTPLQLYQYPTTGDQASPAGVQTLAQAIEKQVVAVFPDTGTRDSRWTAATGLANGAMCFITATGELQLRSAGAWVVIGGRAAPYAVAQGTTAYTMTAVTNVTVATSLPTGRFSVTPLVQATLQTAGGGSSKLVLRVLSASTTTFSINVSTGDGTSVSNTGETFAWYAVQMTSAAAAG